MAEKIKFLQDKLDREPPLRLLGLDEFATQPKARWLVRGILPHDALAVVFGPPKGGKTFTVCDLLMHAAHGLDWHGHAVPRPLRIAFLAGEGRNGLRVRLHAWLQHHDSAELGGDFKVLPASLSLPDRVDELIALLGSFKPDVIAPDTLNAFFGAGDENSTQDMTRFVGALRTLRDALSCSVLLLHHTSLADSGRERGSGVLRGAADVVIQVGKDESGSGAIGFQVVAARDIEPMGKPLALKLERVPTDWTDENGESITTCIVTSAAQPVVLAGNGSRPLGDTQKAILSIARDLAAEKTPDAGGFVILARPEIAAKAKERGITRSSVSSAWQPLEMRGHLTRVEPASVRLKVRA